MRVLFWFRKDLRLEDNAGLSAAARDASGDVVPFYASEPTLLARPDMAATRVRFVLDSLADLAAQCERAGSALALDHGDAAETVVRAARAAGADAVYWNDEYEPALAARDARVERALHAAGVKTARFHDRLLVPPGAVRTKGGGPYTVYTAFRRACEALGEAAAPAPWPLVTRLAPHELPRRRLATLARLGFAEPAARRWPGGSDAGRRRLARFVSEGLARYAAERDLPAAEATSRLSADLRFGTIGVRTVVRAVREAAAEGGGRGAARLRASADKYVAELRWRDFYAHVLHGFPHCESGSFRRAYDAITWPGEEAHFAAWAEGRTGYPIVDAGMRELAATGFMHNRVRMITASFLTKDLLVDWRRGERHFMTHLVDGDPASNNGGWQWTAGTGTDAQPYFRVFNPSLQGARFDPEGAYVRRWAPELARVPACLVHRPWEAAPAELASRGVTLGGNYPLPIVRHEEQRERALALYAAARGRP